MNSLPALFLSGIIGMSALAADANRLAHLDDTSPFWPAPDSPKLTTPQWIGEPGVEAVVILAIDDMRDPAKYEAFLRPILERLKRIDGLAPVSIMTNTVPVDDPQLQAWLAEGVSIENHTLTHPCPLLGKAGFDEAARTVHGGVDLLASIPRNRPVAFRMPCCDSMNSLSPRFFSEIFNRNSAQGRWMAIDSSVFTLPPGERFAKYFPQVLRPPAKVSFADYSGYIEDHPFPYVIGRKCWEFPCMVPSDWEAFNVLGPKSAAMVEDWKAGLDRVVEQRGVFTAVLHPHGWSAPEQWVEFINYAVEKFGPRVKFLTFPEALARLEKNALGGFALRKADGDDAGARLLDVDGDGFMDVVAGGEDRRVTRVWQPAEQRWLECPTPAFVRDAAFGVLSGNAASMLTQSAAWTFNGNRWQPDAGLAAGLADIPPRGRRLRDFDRDGVCELLADSDIFAWKDDRWQPAGFALPEDCRVLDDAGADNGLRFVDLNGDGFDDVFQSNGDGYAIHLWAKKVRDDLGWKRGWPHLVADGKPAARLMPFVKDGGDNGAWFHRGHVVWQNEDTFDLEAHTLRRSFADVIAFDMPPAKSPADALAAMRPRPGFTVEVVAAEPLVVDPVAFEWDAQGRLWVVEMRDYPLGMDGKGQPGGVVKVLTDDDRDGRCDRATVFLDDVLFPTGVLPWRDGALVFAVPDILFARDTDGDGRADERRVLFTGFKPGNQQHRANGFALGLDGWVYGANGDSGGTINGVNISGRDFRFRPDTGEFEAVTGSGQYGRQRDDWGNWFGNNNPTWLWHYTIEDRYLRRNPKLAVKRTKQVLTNYDNPTRVFTAYAGDTAPIRFNQPQSLGHVTSACSPAPYRDTLFGPDFATSVFICEPVHNVVHREVLEPDGATFTSHRAADEMDREFLASADPWFRPVFAKTGPDGALYIADMQRFVLEHPEWIAPETQSRLDLRAGSDRGRIWRIFPTNRRPRGVPDLTALSDFGLVLALDHSNGWQRDTIQRLLIEHGAAETAHALKRIAREAANPKVRVQAIATLVGLSSADDETIRAGIRDADPRVRVQALRASESSPTPEILSIVAACEADPELIVRRQCAFTLGEFRDHPHANETLARLAERDGDRPDMREAILSSLSGDDPLFSKLNAAAPPAAPIPDLPKPTTPDRAKVIVAYSGVAKLSGDPVRGAQLFQANCAICHRWRGQGNEAGPDLAMTAGKPIDWLLAAIFDPNAAIEPRYQAEIIKTKEGVEWSGIVASETANNLTLRLPGGAEQAILRIDIAERKPTGRSLMPEGLETVLKPQDIADIVAALREP